MTTIKGILSFPNIFTARIAKGASEPKFNCTVLLPPDDPQLIALNQEIEIAKKDAFPSGYNGTDCCLNAYDTKYAGKDYYDPRFSGWWVFSCSSKENDRPIIVDSARMPVVDPGSVYAGMVAYISVNISGYTKGRGGIGGWLNGVMLTDEEPPMGRLDNKPSAEQMFSGVGSTSAAAAAVTMTPAANGVTYEQYMATPGWTEKMLIDQGLAVKNNFR